MSTAPASESSAAPTRVLVWDEQQPEQRAVQAIPLRIVANAVRWLARSGDLQSPI